VVTTLDALPDVLRAEHVAALLGVGRNHVYTLAKEGRIPGVLPLGSRTLRFSKAAIAAWLDAPVTN
jgi:excisionase family DNA binding protein